MSKQPSIADATHLRKAIERSAEKGKVLVPNWKPSENEQQQQLRRAKTERGEKMKKTKLDQWHQTPKRTPRQQANAHPAREPGTGKFTTTGNKTKTARLPKYAPGTGIKSQEAFGVPPLKVA